MGSYTHILFFSGLIFIYEEFRKCMNILKNEYNCSYLFPLSSNCERARDTCEKSIKKNYNSIPNYVFTFQYAIRYKFILNVYI